MFVALEMPPLEVVSQVHRRTLSLVAAVTAMATPLACFIPISVKREAAGEATAVRIERESKSPLAAWLHPPAAENVSAHCAVDGAVLPFIRTVDATDLIAAARKLQRPVMGQVHARKISARRGCCAGRGAGASRRGNGDFERVGLARTRRVNADGVVARRIQHTFPTVHVLSTGNRLDVVPLRDDCEAGDPGRRGEVDNHSLACANAQLVAYGLAGTDCALEHSRGGPALKRDAFGTGALRARVRRAQQQRQKKSGND